MSLEVIYQAKAIWYEGLIAIGLGFILVLSFTATDVSFFDDYVLTILAWCHPSIQDAFCTEFREQHGLGITEQNGIGNKYWDRLAGQAVEVFAIMFLVRMGFGAMLQMQHVRNIRLTTVFMAVIWGASGFTLFMFGVLDTFYFIIQGEDIPSQLEWLDNVGVFTQTKALFGDPNVVDRNDLFATNLIGIGILGILIFGNAILYRIRGYSNRTIA